MSSMTLSAPSKGYRGVKSPDDKVTQVLQRFEGQTGITIRTRDDAAEKEETYVGEKDELEEEEEKRKKRGEVEVRAVSMKAKTKVLPGESEKRQLLPKYVFLRGSWINLHR